MPPATYILTTQSLALPPSVEVVAASCKYILISQCLSFAFLVLQYLLNQFFFMLNSLFSDWTLTRTSGDKKTGSLLSGILASSWRDRR